jgi:hypothetical protein
VQQDFNSCGVTQVALTFVEGEGTLDLPMCAPLLCMALKTPPMPVDMAPFCKGKRGMRIDIHTVSMHVSIDQFVGDGVTDLCFMHCSNVCE